MPRPTDENAMVKEPVPGSGVPRRVLAQHLRDLRNQAGLTVKVAAGLMEWSEPKECQRQRRAAFCLA